MRDGTQTQTQRGKGEIYELLDGKYEMGRCVFLGCLLVFFAFSGPQGVCGNADMSALMEVKVALDPDNKVLSSWTSTADYCSGAFQGVACNDNREVNNISLQGKGLSGVISPAVAGLKSLSGLYVHYNSLTGAIPPEISSLTKLVDLYLDFNNLSGSIPPQIGSMTGLQVLQLCYNQLSGSIPVEIGSMKNLGTLSLQHNKLNGSIPVSIGSLGMLKRLNLSFNELSGTVPSQLADMSQLEALDVRNNSLSGTVPQALDNLNDGFQFINNPGLCGFPPLRNCSNLDDVGIHIPLTGGLIGNKTAAKVNPEAAIIIEHCNQTLCSSSSKSQKIAIIAGSVTSAVTLICVGILLLFRHRRGKQKISSSIDAAESQCGTEHAKESYSRRTPSPLASLEYSNGWDPFSDGPNCSGFSPEFLRGFRFNLEEVESATQYFSDANFLGRSKFSAVHKGTLRDGSHVAIRTLNVTSCKSEEDEFAKGLTLLTSLKHENLVQLRGFCCSRGKGECYLIYDFAPHGSLSKYLDVQDGGHKVLDWSTRVSIIGGIAKGIGYLHSNQPNKPALIHQNISAEKVLLDQHFNPLISGSGLPKLLADDVVFSTLKVSAAMGYLAPEYITTGRFTEKSDIYAFGVIILQLLSGSQLLSSSMKAAAEAESSKLMEFMDTNLQGKILEPEAAKLAKIAIACTHQVPDERPTMLEVMQELSTSTET